MGTVKSLVTIDANGTTSHEWDYVDAHGISHMIKDTKTFYITVDDTDSTHVRYAIVAPDSAGTACFTGVGYMETYDKEAVRFRPECTTESSGLSTRNGMDLLDAQDGVAIVDEGNSKLNWVIPMSCTASADVVQYWKVTAITIGNVDISGATTITVLKMEDQFGNTMSLPSIGSGIDAGQAA